MQSPRPAGRPASCPTGPSRPANLASALAGELVAAHRQGSVPARARRCPPSRRCARPSRSAAPSSARRSRCSRRRAWSRSAAAVGTTVTPPLMWNMLDEFVLAASIAEANGLEVLDDVVVTRRLLESDMANVAARQADEEVVAPAPAAGRARWTPSSTTRWRTPTRTAPSTTRSCAPRATASPEPSCGPWRARWSTRPGTSARSAATSASRRTTATATSTCGSPRTTRAAPPRRCSPTSPRPGRYVAAAPGEPVRLRR